MKPDPFWYPPGPALWVGPNTRVVTLGSELEDKRAIFDALATQLDIPDSAPPGEMTWDDMVALLSELDWPAVEGATSVVLFHLALPDLHDDMLAVYLDALRRALDGRGNEAPRLLVAFPADAQERVSMLTRPG